MDSFTSFKAHNASYAASATQVFNTALLNLRGSLQKEWSREERQLQKHGVTQSKVASYKVCGPTPFTAHVVKHHTKLKQLSQLCFASLVEHIHYALLETQVAQNLYKECNKATELGATLDSSLNTALNVSDMRTDLSCKIAQCMNLNVGMSGGADSTLVLVLACALRDKYGYGVRAIHCIHGLDPDDEIWLQHNCQLCDSLQVELHTPVLKIVYGAGVSPEDISRQERYRALLGLTNPLSDCLLLGHQADDQVENFLLALKRGSGPQGLAGMRLLTEDERGTLVRPLLDLHKIELEQILTDLGFSYVYDLSNGYLKFERNFIRLKVLPILRQRFAGIDKAILRSQRLCAFEHDLALRYVHDKAESFLVRVAFAPFVALDSTKLDLSDAAFVTLLIRHFLSTTLQEQGLKPSIDYNLVERCYELLLSPHDANGCLKVLGTPYVAATFLNYLYLYEPFSSDELVACQGQHVLSLGQSIKIGAMCYSLELVDSTELLANPDLQGQVFRLKESAVTPQQSKVTQEAQRLQESPQPCNVPQQPCSGSQQLSKVPWVCLDFSYAQSLKIKPRLRQHSREIKKLFVEYKVAPWLRKTVPLVKDVNSEILALGDICAIGQGRGDFASGLIGYYRLVCKKS